MTQFVEVIERAVGGLTVNSAANRSMVYEKARRAVLRQLRNMRPAPPERMILNQLAKLEEAIEIIENRQPQNQVTAPSEPPTIPAQRPGISFAIKPSGLVGIASNSVATEEDLTHVGELRNVLREAVEDLITLTSGSNAYRHIEVIATRYRSALTNEHGELLVDLLYAYGVRLENAAMRLRRDISHSEYPDMDLALSEALDSVIALHGPTVMSTSLGRDLVARAKAYKIDETYENEYREKAVSLWRDVRPGNRVIEHDDIEELIQINIAMGESATPLHSNSIAHATNSNILVLISKLAIYGAGGIVLSKAFEDSQIGSTAALEITTLMDRSYHFFIQHQQSLGALAVVAGQELGWIQSLIRYLQIKRGTVKFRE